MRRRTIAASNYRSVLHFDGSTNKLRRLLNHVQNIYLLLARSGTCNSCGRGGCAWLQNDEAISGSGKRRLRLHCVRQLKRSFIRFPRHRSGCARCCFRIVLGKVEDTPGVHGIAIVPSLHRGFTTNGGEATVSVFDTNTFKTLKENHRTEGSRLHVLRPQDQPGVRVPRR